MRCLLRRARTRALTGASTKPSAGRPLRPGGDALHGDGPYRAGKAERAALLARQLRQLRQLGVDVRRGAGFIHHEIDCSVPHQRQRRGAGSRINIQQTAMRKLRQDRTASHPASRQTARRAGCPQRAGHADITGDARQRPFQPSAGSAPARGSSSAPAGQDRSAEIPAVPWGSTAGIRARPARAALNSFVTF